MESNVNTNYQSRELKTVNIRDTHSQFLKFTMEANYVNNHNLFNQVGLISVCAFGDKLGFTEDDEKPTKGNQAEFDKNTMAKLKSLESDKKKAIDEEDYDRAQMLKK